MRAPLMWADQEDAVSAGKVNDVLLNRAVPVAQIATIAAWAFYCINIAF